MDTASRRDPDAPSRQRLVTRPLAAAVRSLAQPGVAPTVLDCGGGSGSTAVPLAQAGARVTVVDVSADALATLHRRAAESGVDELVQGVQGDVEALAELMPAGSFDMVLVHGVLEAVDRPEVALAGAVAAVRPGGLVSVLVSNPVASVLSRALAGDVATALLELRALVAGSSEPLDLPGVRARCEELGLVVEHVHGVGVFTELIAGGDLEPGPAGGPRGAALAELEQLASERSPFREIASRIHLLARRPG